MAEDLHDAAARWLMEARDTEAAASDADDLYSTRFLTHDQARELYRRLGYFECALDAWVEACPFVIPGPAPKLTCLWYARLGRLIAGLLELNAARLDAQADNLVALADFLEGSGSSASRPPFEPSGSSQVTRA